MFKDNEIIQKLETLQTCVRALTVDILEIKSMLKNLQPHECHCKNQPVDEPQEVEELEEVQETDLVLEEIPDEPEEEILQEQDTLKKKRKYKYGV